MNKNFTRISLTLAALALAQGINAQENLLANKPIFTLGEAKTWTNTAGTFTFDPATLDKIVADPANTSNIYLFPEVGGGWNTAENKEIGIQGFYVDMGAEQEVARVSSTWEGASASSYVMYVTNDAPTLDILNSEPTYRASGLGQYTANVAELPEGTKGRYLVFQPTDATNWGWGVKIKSMSAIAPFIVELTEFSVSPSMAVLNTPTPVTLSFKNQVGDAIDPSEVTVSVSSNATYENGMLTINEGTEATLTAKMDDKEVTATVTAVSAAPGQPGLYQTAIFLSNDADLDSKVNLMLGYNGGAKQLPNVTFPDGEIAMAFTETQCVFFGNSSTLGNWGTKFVPAEKGFRALHMEVYSTKDVTANIMLEGAGTRTNNNVALEANKWNDVNVSLIGVDNVNNYSLRMSAADACDVLVTNVYFTPMAIEGDETAPTNVEVTGEGGIGSVVLTMKATDDLNPKVDYTITWGENSAVVEGNSGEAVTYEITELSINTEYTFEVVAGDGKNFAEPVSVTVKTLGLEDAPVVVLDTEKYDVVGVYGSSFNATEVPGFDAWGSAGKLGTMDTENGETVLYFSSYFDQWGGLNVNAELGEVCNTVCIDLFPLEDVENAVITVAPVWTGANGATTPDKEVSLEAMTWNHIELPLTDFGYPDYGTEVGQFALNHPNFATFAIANFYFIGEKPVVTPPEDGISTITVEDAATAEYFTLQGVRMTGKLVPGLYIRRQGNEASKVIVM
nr:fibronectin type III domain-containing protein [Bacteroides sp.]